MTTSDPPPSLTSFHYPTLNTATSSSSLWGHQNLNQNRNESHRHNLINPHSNFGLPSDYLNSPSQSCHQLLDSSNDLNLNCNIPVSSHSSLIKNIITTSAATSNMTSSSSSNLNNSLYPINSTTSSHPTSPPLLHNHQHIQQQQQLAQHAFYTR